MKKFLSYLFLCAALMAPVALTPSCKSANRNAFVGVSILHTTVRSAMGAWDVLVANGKTTPAQELVVKGAYEKVQRTAIALTDAGKLLSAAGGSANASAALTAAFEQAVTDYAQDKSDLFAVLAQNGVFIQ